MYVDMTEEIEYQEAIITQQRMELIVGNLHQHLVAKHGYCRLHGMSSERECFFSKFVYHANLIMPIIFKVKRCTIAKLSV